MKPHIAMLGFGTGSWGVYDSRTGQRLIGWNNTFRTFREASRYAGHIYVSMYLGERA